MAGDDVILSYRPATSAFTLDSLHSLIQADLAQVQKCSSATPKKSKKSGDDIIRELRQNRRAKEKLTESKGRRRRNRYDNGSLIISYTYYNYFCNLSAVDLFVLLSAADNFLSHPFAVEYDSEDDDDILPKRSDSFSLLIHSRS